MKRLGRLGRGCLISVALAASMSGGAQPALAFEDPEDAGIFAALGLSAADGKTSLSGSAGTIEANLLSSESVNEASAIIAGLINARGDGPGNERVLVLTSKETVNLLNLRTILHRVNDLSARAAHPQMQCSILPSENMLESTALRPALSDIVAAAATTTAFAAITTTVDERLIVNSLVVNARARVNLPRSEAPRPAAWQAASWASEPSRRNVTYVLPSEAQGADNGTLFMAYSTLLNRVDQLRPCATRDDVKALLAIIDPFVTSLNTATGDPPLSPLTRAIQLDSAISSQQNTSILRLAIEAQGGTTATRSSVWYTLGFPGAATVSSGILVSFRVIDANSGAPSLTGVIRCAERPRSLRSIENFVRRRRDGARCTYIAGPFAERN